MIEKLLGLSNRKRKERAAEHKSVFSKATARNKKARIELSAALAKIGKDL